MIVPLAKGGLKQLMNVIYQYIYIILVNYFWHMCSCTVVAHIAKSIAITAISAERFGATTHDVFNTRGASTKSSPWAFRFAARFDADHANSTRQVYIQNVVASTRVHPAVEDEITSVEVRAAAW